MMRADPATAIADTVRIFLPPNQVTELRILNSARGVLSGYFNEPDKLAAAAALWSGKSSGVYFIPNFVNPALLARATNRLVERPKQTTSDLDIVRRRWLLLDFDPTRPAGISSTTAEHRAALERAKECFAWLRDLGFSALVLADSGNGDHILIPIDLPNDAASTALVRRCIEAVALRFSDDVVSVDLSVHNAARIWKLYGTLACKGDSTGDRPHRLAQIREISGSLTPAPRELLDRLAGLAPDEPKTHSRHKNYSPGLFDLSCWIAEHHLETLGPYSWKDGQKWIFPICPWNPDHTNRAAYLVQFASGAVAAGC